MKGTIAQIIGPVVDVRFEEEMPAILTALVVERTEKDRLMIKVSK